MKGTFPIPNFQGIYHLNNYSISYSIEQQHKIHNHNKLIECIGSNQQIPYDTSIVLPISQYGDKGKIKLSFYHQPNEIEFYLNVQSYELISYMFDLNSIYKYKKRKVEGIVIYIKVDNNGLIHLMGFDYVFGDNTTAKINYEQGMVDVLNNGLYYGKDIKKNKVNYLLNEENKYLKMDKEFEEYSVQKNNIEGKCYSLRDVINNSKKEHVEYKNTNKTLMEILNSIEEDLRDAGDKKINLTPIYQQIVDIASIVGYNMN
jgi:molecular chaperone DnaK (HSP70)